MTDEIERRLKNLEDSRYRLNGQLSAISLLLVSAWYQIIKQEDDIEAAAKRLSDAAEEISRQKGFYLIPAGETVDTDRLDAAKAEALEVLLRNLTAAAKAKADQDRANNA